MLRRIVLDVLKPHEPSMVSFTRRLSEMDGVTGATAKLVEMEENVRTVRVAIEGEHLDFDAIETEISDLGGSIHSVDEVSCGEEIVEDRWITKR